MVNAPGLPVTQVYWMELLSPNIDENGNEERLATAMQPGRAASITARKLAPNTSVEEFISMQDAAWKRVQTYLDKDDKSKNVSNNKGIGR